MKETVKVGIGGYAFTCDVDAYELLDRYLNNLKSHFRNKSDGAEIITDIEGRMSELLSLKADSPAYIISLEDARDIIEIMGNPSDIVDGEDLENNNENPIRKNKKESPTTGKKLYRDPDNAIMGGVFSGLGYYFRIDPVILRIVYLLITFFWFGAFDQYGMISILAYFILWIVVPKATTFEQKLAMTGKDPSVRNITLGNVSDGGMRGSGIGKVLKAIIKILIGIILFFIALIFIVATFSIFVVPSFLDHPSNMYILETLGLYSTTSMIMVVTVWFIPAFMFIYLIIRLMKRFMLRDLAVLGIAFFTFLGAVFYLAIKGVNYAKDYKHEASYTDSFVPNMDSDTLRIELNKQYLNSEILYNSTELYVVEEDGLKSLFMIPQIKIERDSTYKQIKVGIKKQAFGKNLQLAEDKARNARFEITDNNSTLTVNPHLYDKNNIWDREFFSITVYCPEDKTIIVDGLLESRTRGSRRPEKKEIVEETNNSESENQSVENKDTIVSQDSIKASVEKQIL